MAERIGVHRNTITHWENDAQEASPHRIRQWAVITGAPESWLLGDDVAAAEPVQLTLDLGGVTVAEVDLRDCVTVSSPFLVAA
jgi:transcriptional regulator with XRE-family HTH domain